MLALLKIDGGNLIGSQFKTPVIDLDFQGLVGGIGDQITVLFVQKKQIEQIANSDDPQGDDEA